MKDNVRRAKQAQRLDRKQIGVSRTSPHQMNFPFSHVSVTDPHRGKSKHPCLHSGAGSETPNPLMRSLTLMHLRVAMKEFIQQIRTLDEGGHAFTQAPLIQFTNERLSPR